jgi:hypothetical protein
MTYHRVCNKGNTTGATCGAGTAYLSGAPEITPSFLWGLCSPRFLCRPTAFFRLAGVEKKFMKNSVANMVLVIVKLFNKILQLGKFPKQWNISHISSMFKSGDQND